MIGRFFLKLSLQLLIIRKCFYSIILLPYIMCFQWVQWNCQTFYTFNQTLHLSTILRILTIMLLLATLRIVEPQLVYLIQIFLISPSFILYGNTAIEDWSYSNKTRSRQNFPSSAQLLFIQTPGLVCQLLAGNNKQNLEK